MAGPRNIDQFPDRVRWDRWLRRRRAAVDDWQAPLGVSLQQPSEIFIKGDVAFELLSTVILKGDTAFAFESEFIKGDTALIAVVTRYVKGDTVFAITSVYIKGDAALLENVPLPDLGEDPAATKPGAISRTWLQVKSVTKDVT